MGRSRLLLADDHALLLEAIRMILEPEFEVVGSVEDGQALLVAAEELKPDVILLGISMPVLNGIDAARQLRKVVPSSKLIFLTMHGDASYVTAAFRAGASGYLLKCASASELRAAIREVLKGHYYMSPPVTHIALERLLGGSKSKGKFGDSLTPRQRQILQLVAEGRTRKEIAGTLGISLKTVEFHKASLAREVNLRTPSDFTRYAIEHGMIPVRLFF